MFNMYYNSSMSLLGLGLPDNQLLDVTQTGDRFTNASMSTSYTVDTTGLPHTDHQAISTEGTSIPSRNVSLTDVLLVMWNETSDSSYKWNTETQANDSNSFFITNSTVGNISFENFRTSYDNGNHGNLSDIGLSSFVDVSNLSFSLNTSAGWFWQYFDTTGAVTDLSIKERSTGHSDIDAFTAVDLSPLMTLITSANPRIDGLGEPHAMSWDVVLKVVVLAIISIVGFLGNVRAIWSVVKESHLHRPPFYFLLSLGVTDLSRAVFCLPVVITTVLHGAKWRHGESACKLFAFATSFFIFSSALSLLAIAIDRHISIVYSKTYRRRSLGVANLIAAIIIWVIAFSVSFPPVVGVGNYVFIPEEAQCAYQHKHYTSNDSVSSVLVFLAILFLTYFLYFRIFRFLRAHRRMRPLQHAPARSSNWAFVGPGANGQAFINWLNGFGGQVPIRQGGQRTVQRLNFGRVVNLSTAKNEHLTRLFLVLTLVFGLSWTPYVILSLWRIFLDDSLLPSSYVTISAWLGYAQVAFCPLVYFMCRRPSKKGSRTVYSQAEKREFLLENKIGK